MSHTLFGRTKLVSEYLFVAQWKEEKENALRAALLHVRVGFLFCCEDVSRYTPASLRSNPTEKSAMYVPKGREDILLMSICFHTDAYVLSKADT